MTFKRVSRAGPASATVLSQKSQSVSSKNTRNDADQIAHGFPPEIGQETARNADDADFAARVTHTGSRPEIGQEAAQKSRAKTPVSVALDTPGERFERKYTGGSKSKYHARFAHPYRPLIRKRGFADSLPTRLRDIYRSPAMVTLAESMIDWVNYIQQDFTKNSLRLRFRGYGTRGGSPRQRRERAIQRSQSGIYATGSTRAGTIPLYTTTEVVARIRELPPEDLYVQYRDHSEERFRPPMPPPGMTATEFRRALHELRKRLNAYRHQCPESEFGPAVGG